MHAHQHRKGAILAEGDHWHVVEPRDIPAVDRIGGGDGVPRPQTWGCGLPTSPRTFGTCGYAVDAARPRRHASPDWNDMTSGQIATVLALAAGFLGVLAVGFFTGFANTWPIIVFVLGGTFLIHRK